jgi:hypothetical protein
MKTLKVICIMLFGPVLGMGIAFLAAVLSCRPTYAKCLYCGQ